MVGASWDDRHWSTILVKLCACVSINTDTFLHSGKKSTRNLKSSTVHSLLIKIVVVKHIERILKEFS